MELESKERKVHSLDFKEAQHVSTDAWPLYLLIDDGKGLVAVPVAEVSFNIAVQGACLGARKN